MFIGNRTLIGLMRLIVPDWLDGLGNARCLIIPPNHQPFFSHQADQPHQSILRSISDNVYWYPLCVYRYVGIVPEEFEFVNKNLTFVRFLLSIDRS